MDERSNDELRASIVAHELVIDAVRSVLEKGEHSPEDEEYVIECLHPTTIGTNELALLSGDVENKLEALSELPRKREIPGLRSLVEQQLNETFSVIEKLDVACGFTGEANLLTEDDILTSVSQVQDSSNKLIAGCEKLQKRWKEILQSVKESVDPVVDSVSALKNELLENIAEISQLENSKLDEKFKDVPTEVLKRLVNDLEEEVKAGDPGSKAAEEPELDDRLVAAAAELERINEEIALKKALLDTFFSDKS